jgi:flagellar biosynthetic protein FlhB
LAQDSDDSDKSELPSQHRLEESRKKGDVASSKELGSILLLSGTLMTVILSSVFVYESFVEYLEYILKQDPTEFYSKEKFFEVIKETAWVGFKCVAPVFAASALIGFLAQFGQIGFLYSPEILNLNFERINPINGFKKLFTKKSIVEAMKGLLKFAIVIAITYNMIKNNSHSFLGFLHADVSESLMFGKSLIIKLGFSILGGLGVIAILDFAWEKYAYQKKLMMTKQEVKEESKEKDGNPEVRNRIRQIQRQMAQKRMMNDVKKADVIVTNPTHISVALKYDGVNMLSPEVVGKGADHLALKIRELAKEYDIPIVENIPLARTLYKTVKVGHPVPKSLYRAVAEVIAFVYKLKKKRKRSAVLQR